MAEGGTGGVATASRMAGSPQMFTDWDEIMNDIVHNKGGSIQFLLSLHLVHTVLLLQYAL